MKVFFTFVITLCSIYTCYSQKKIASTCENHKIHTVQHSFLQQKLGEKIPVTYIGPKYKKGIYSIKQHFNNFFEKNKINDLVLQVYIVFTVNCQGKAGNFELLNSTISQRQDAIASTIIEKLKELPHSWHPASKYNRKIDSYQVLEFVIVQGNLQKVNYK